MGTGSLHYTHLSSNDDDDTPTHSATSLYERSIKLGSTPFPSHKLMSRHLDIELGGIG